MSEEISGLTNDEEADAEPIAPFRIEASECFEQSWHGRTDDTDPGIEYIDPHRWPEMTAADKYATAGVGVFDGVAHQVAENNAEEQRITDNGCSCSDHTYADVFLGRDFSVFMTSLP